MLVICKRGFADVGGWRRGVRCHEAVDYCIVYFSLFIAKKINITLSDLSDLMQLQLQAQLCLKARHI